MALSYISFQQRPFQGEYRQFPLSTTQQRLRPLQPGTRTQPHRIFHSIPGSTPISITRNQTPWTTTLALNNQGAVASLIRRPDHLPGIFRLILPPPIIGPASILTTSSPPLVHSLKDNFRSPTLTSLGFPTPPLNRVYRITIPSRAGHMRTPSF
jgi:hypothetical protein